MKHQLLISIIVPVYNVENYIEKCIESLVKQTYSNLEIIAVDDGSTDDSGKICDKYAEVDSRVKVIHKQNGGLSSSREKGINAATGDYIMMVDGDDWIETDTVEKCVEIVTNNQNIDCVLFSYIKEFSNNSIPMHVMDGSRLFSPAEAEENVYRRLFGLYGDELRNPERMDNIVSCCMKLYKSSIAKKGRYFDNRIVGSSEDTLFNMYALYQCESVAYIDECLYHYRKIETSHTNSYRENLDKKWGVLFGEMKKVITEKNLPEKYTEALSNRIAMSIIGIGMNEVGNKKVGYYDRYTKVKCYVESNLYQTACKQLPVNQMPLIWKVFFCCCKLKFSFAVFLMLMAIMLLRKH